MEVFEAVIKKLVGVNTQFPFFYMKQPIIAWYSSISSKESYELKINTIL